MGFRVSREGGAHVQDPRQAILLCDEQWEYHAIYVRRMSPVRHPFAKHAAMPRSLGIWSAGIGDSEPPGYTLALHNQHIIYDCSWIECKTMGLLSPTTSMGAQGTQTPPARQTDNAVVDLPFVQNCVSCTFAKASAAMLPGP